MNQNELMRAERRQKSKMKTEWIMKFELRIHQAKRRLSEWLEIWWAIDSSGWLSDTAAANQTRKQTNSFHLQSKPAIRAKTFAGLLKIEDCGMNLLVCFPGTLNIIKLRKLKLNANFDSVQFDYYNSKFVIQEWNNNEWMDSNVAAALVGWFVWSVNLQFQHEFINQLLTPAIWFLNEWLKWDWMNQTNHQLSYPEMEASNQSANELICNHSINWMKFNAEIELNSFNLIDLLDWIHADCLPVELE